MTETLEKAPHDIERKELQDHLATIDRDTDKLQEFIGSLYTRRIENPQLFYAAATHLTALTYLDRRTDLEQQPELPDQHNAERAFTTYARLIAMLGQEMNSPLYAKDDRLRRRLAGAREELSLHLPLAYATAQGADFVALPSPAALDFGGNFRGEGKASDLQLFFPALRTPPSEIQVRFNLEEEGEYEPHIAVLNLATVLGSSEAAGAVRGLLKDVGSRPENEEGQLELTPREHDILMESAAAITQVVTNWQTE
jgi:hypothetical protein